MKTSNKILIATLIFVLFAGTAVHLTLYAKYKSGSFLAETEVKSRLFDSHRLPEIRYVQVRGLSNLRLLTAENARLDVNKNISDWVHYEVRADSLAIWADTADYLANKNNYGNIMEDREIDLYLIPGTNCVADHCIIQASGSSDSLKAASYALTLNNCRIQFGDYRFWEKKPEYFGFIRLVATDESQVRFTKTIDSLSLTMTNSYLSDEGGRLNGLRLEADSNSTVSLRGANLRLIFPGAGK